MGVAVGVPVAVGVAVDVDGGTLVGVEVAVAIGVGVDAGGAVAVGMGPGAAAAGVGVPNGGVAAGVPGACSTGMKTLTGVAVGGASGDTTGLPRARASEVACRSGVAVGRTPGSEKRGSSGARGVVVAVGVTRAPGAVGVPVGARRAVPGGGHWPRTATTYPGSFR